MLWQTNSEGDDIHVFDLESGTLVQRLVVGPEPHGIAAPADARVVYVSLESNGRALGELLWIDPRAYTVQHRMTLCREPHALATTPDGRWIYVPCRDEHYWVIDSEKKKVVTRIHTGGRPHNTQISRDEATRTSARSPSQVPSAPRRSRSTGGSSSTSTD